MIATLSGVISEKIKGTLVLDIGGVGYGLLVTGSDFDVPIGTPVKFYVYEHIREQAHDLFGFSDLDGLRLFEQLLGVKNVGPKVALAVLDSGTNAAVRQAIASGDIKALQTAKGVGKRAAEQIVVELRDKVGLASTDAAEGVVTRSGAAAQDEAVQALIALGYSDADASRALQGVPDDLSVEARVTQALRLHS